jgi:hypothetical protein
MAKHTTMFIWKFQHDSFTLRFGGYKYNQLTELQIITPLVLGFLFLM